MTTVLVTGGTGFVGRPVVAALRARGLDVVAPSSDDIDLLRDDPDSLCGGVHASHLLHLAWCARPGFWTSPENERWVEATLRLAAAFARHGGNRIVVAGSGAEYARSDVPADELETPLDPQTPYGKAKVSLHQQLTTRAPELGLTYAEGRIFQLYGPGEDPGRLIPSVITSLVRHEPAVCTVGTQRRDFVHVDDVAGALIDLLVSKLDGPVNIGTGLATPVAEVAQSIGDLLGEPELVRLERPLPADEPPLLVAGLRRSSAELGWKAGIDLQAGLAKTVDWWRGHRP